MKRILLYLCCLVSGRLLAADAPPPPPPDLVARAEKIVAALQLAEPTKAARVRDIVAAQYAALRPIHQHRDNALELAKAEPETNRATLTERARNDATARQAALAYAFLGKLSAELTPDQIVQIKDGMTYGVVPLTFGVYQKMFPNLTAEQRAQVYAWLVEAREHAMSASTSDEKHGWFGKYKGRINNYLSAAGYNLKEAEKNLKK